MMTVAEDLVEKDVMTVVEEVVVLVTVAAEAAAVVEEGIDLRQKGLNKKVDNSLNQNPGYKQRTKYVTA